MHLEDDITVRSVTEESRTVSVDHVPFRSRCQHSEDELGGHGPSTLNRVETPKSNLERVHVNVLHPIPPGIASLSDEERSLLERSLVLSLDVRLMPLLILFYILNFLDRVRTVFSASLLLFYGQQIL